jgi:hypothetical protein
VFFSHALPLNLYALTLTLALGYARVLWSVVPASGALAAGHSDGKCRQMTKRGAATMAESASELRAPEGIRTPNLLIRRHRPVLRPGTIRVLLPC